MPRRRNVVPYTATVPIRVADWRRQVNRQPNLIDLVEMELKKVVESKGVEFTKYIDARKNEDAVTGNLLLDDFHAMQELRDQAAEDGIVDIGNAKEIEVVHAMRRALSRFTLSRKQRRDFAEAAE